MKTFKTLLSQYSFDEILPAFKALYSRNEPKQAENLNWEGYREIYQSLRDLPETKTTLHIRLSSRWEGRIPMIDMNCAVMDGKNTCGPVALYLSWSEIIGMKIAIDNGVSITPQELVAGLLWEITYYGGSEEMAKYNLEHRKPIEVIKRGENKSNVYVFEDKRWSL